GAQQVTERRDGRYGRWGAARGGVDGLFLAVQRQGLRLPGLVPVHIRVAAIGLQDRVDPATVRARDGGATLVQLELVGRSALFTAQLEVEECSLPPCYIVRLVRCVVTTGTPPHLNLGSCRCDLLGVGVGLAQCE